MYERAHEAQAIRYSLKVFHPLSVGSVFIASLDPSIARLVMT